jgi:hypothetical protein
MMYRTNLFPVIIIGMMMLIFSCSKKSDYKNAAEAADTASVNISQREPSSESISSSAAVEKGKDTLRKFIRTAELKFKVKDVIKATYQIEDIVGRFDGFVSYTNLSSNTDYKYTSRVSADSSIELTHFTVVNTMTLRVPNTMLDSTLKAIAPLVEYMDYRIIKADDIGLQILSNRLAEKRINKHEQRMNNAIENRGRKLRETTDAEENLYNKRETADNAMISNLALMDQVNYSTVNLSLYQKQEVKKERVANEENIKSYEPNFASKLVEAMQEGWNMIEAVIVFIARLWGLILFAIAVFLLYRIIRKRFGK